LAAQLDPTGSPGLQSKKFDRDWRPKKPKNRCERNALPLAGEITQPSQQRFTLHMRAREGSRSIFLLRTRAGLVALRTRVNILDSVRLALPRSPESGIAVSIHVKKVSRGKRDMSLIFSCHVYL